MDLKNSVMEIEILSKNLIKPSFQTPNDHPKTYNLSFFDQLSSCQLHVPFFLFYPFSNSSEISFENIDERLEQSLSKLLTHVYPAAGRFSTDGHDSVDCFDQGVTFIKAKINCNFSAFLNVARNDIDLALKFRPKIEYEPSKLTTTPLVAAQVTKFDCGGIALSVSCIHSVIDGFTALKFVYEWAKVSKMEIFDKDINCFSFDLGNIFPISDHLSRTLKSPTKLPRDNEMVARRFVINESSISRLRVKVMDSMDDNGVLSFKPSRVEMVIALLWRTFINVCHKRNGHLRPSLLILPMNLRGKIDVPRYENSFGNFIIEVPVKFIPGETKMELQDFILLLKDVKQKTSVSFAKASTSDIYSMATKFHDEIKQWEENDEVDVCMGSSLCRFPMYDADFGWGKPCLASFGLRRSDMFWLYDKECSTGIVVQADLKKCYMDIFEYHHDVLEFTCK